MKVNPTGGTQFQPRIDAVSVQMKEFGAGQTDSISSGKTKSKESWGAFAKKVVMFVPNLVFSAAWTFVTRVIYFASFCTLCKPGDDPKKLIAALKKFQVADDKGAVWTQFNKDFPNAVGNFVTMAVDYARSVDLGKDLKDASKKAAWDEKHYKHLSKNRLERFTKHDAVLISGTIIFLQDIVDKKEAK